MYIGKDIYINHNTLILSKYIRDMDVQIDKVPSTSQYTYTCCEVTGLNLIHTIPKELQLVLDVFLLDTQH